MFREPVLENFHERFLFLNSQAIGGIQHLRKFCHAQNLAPRRTLGNYVFPRIFDCCLKLSIIHLRIVINTVFYPVLCDRQDIRRGNSLAQESG